MIHLTAPQAAGENPERCTPVAYLIDLIVLVPEGSLVVHGEYGDGGRRFRSWSLPQRTFHLLQRAHQLSHFASHVATANLERQARQFLPMNVSKREAAARTFFSISFTLRSNSFICDRILLMEARSRFWKVCVRT